MLDAIVVRARSLMSPVPYDTQKEPHQRNPFLTNQAGLHQHTYSIPLTPRLRIHTDLIVVAEIRRRPQLERLLLPVDQLMLQRTPPKTRLMQLFEPPIQRDRHTRLDLRASGDDSFGGEVVEGAQSVLLAWGLIEDAPGEALPIHIL